MEKVEKYDKNTHYLVISGFNYLNPVMVAFSISFSCDIILFEMLIMKAVGVYRLLFNLVGRDSLIEEKKEEFL